MTFLKLDKSQCLALVFLGLVLVLVVLCTACAPRKKQLPDWAVIVQAVAGIGISVWMLYAL